MSGPRGGLVALSGEADPEERSEDSDEALFSFRDVNESTLLENLSYLA